MGMGRKRRKDREGEGGIVCVRGEKVKIEAKIDRRIFGERVKERWSR